MKKFNYTLFVILFLINPLALADKWTYVGISGLSTGEKDVYIALDKIIIKENISTLPQLLNFKNQQFLPEGIFFSEKQNWEYDCTNKLTRQINSLIYKKKMGRGKLIRKTELPSKDWEEILPGTAKESKWIVACKQFKKTE